jgi:hypothetical protein
MNPNTNSATIQKLSLGSYIFLFIAWPFLASVFLLFFGLITSFFSKPLTYSNSYNASFYQFTFLTCLSYVVALVVSTIVLKTSIKRANPLFVTLLMGFVYLLMMWWRVLGSGVAHLDCADNCADSIIPQRLDSQVTVIVAIVLAVIVIASLLFMYRRYKWSP